MGRARVSDVMSHQNQNDDAKYVLGFPSTPNNWHSTKCDPRDTCRSIMVRLRVGRWRRL